MYLETSQQSMMEIFHENSQRLKAVNYFRKKPQHTYLTGFSIRLSGGYFINIFNSNYYC